MNMYIRTEDGIYESNDPNLKLDYTLFEIEYKINDNLSSYISGDEILKVAFCIEDLCDWFGIYYNQGDPYLERFESFDDFRSFRRKIIEEETRRGYKSIDGYGYIIADRITPVRVALYKYNVQTLGNFELI